MTTRASSVVYHPGYNITFFGLERLHPFDGRKYARAYALLRRQFGRRALGFERDKFVIDLLAGRGLPTVVLTSGGYSAESGRMVARTAAYVLGGAKAVPRDDADDDGSA